MLDDSHVGAEGQEMRDHTELRAFELANRWLCVSTK